MSFLSMMPEDRIESWRQRVPSRLERRDPFEGDGFDERPATRLVGLSHQVLQFKADYLLADFS